MDRLIEALKRSAVATFIIISVAIAIPGVALIGSVGVGMVLYIFSEALGTAVAPFGNLKTGALIFTVMFTLFAVAHFIFPSKE